MSKYKENDVSEWVSVESVLHNRSKVWQSEKMNSGGGKNKCK